MPVSRISRSLGVNYAGARAVVKTQVSGVTVRCYGDAAGQNALPGYPVADAAGNLDFYVPEAGPYNIDLYTASGAFIDQIVDVAGSTLAPRVTTVTTSRTLTAADNGMVLECTTTVTLTVPNGLPAGFSCTVIPSGTTSIARSGTALINGAGTTITRAAATAANFDFRIIARASAVDSYVVTGA